MNAQLVFCTFPDQKTARQIGTVLIDEQLAACVNLIPQIESIYRWDGAIQTDSEVLALFKTSTVNYQHLQTRLLELHPYETPECIAVDVANGAPAYLKWLLGEQR